MYACPYCRYHLNTSVILNREIDMYPMEYILLGRDPTQTDFVVDLRHKLEIVKDGPTLRLFFWKLHNTVSSSIERTEPWYHKEQRPLYTTRFWPSLKSELVRNQIWKEKTVPTSLVHSLYLLIQPMTMLAGARRDFERAGEEGDAKAMLKIAQTAVLYISDLEKAVVYGKFLEDTYRFNPHLVDKPVLGVTEQEEQWGRSGSFVAW